MARQLGFWGDGGVESRARERSWGRFKERVGDFGVRALDGELAGDLGVTGERGTRGKQEEGDDLWARVVSDTRVGRRARG